MDRADIDKRFTYHPPKGNQQERYENLRQYARELADWFNSYCPESREKSLAMTHLEEAVMWANASIARNELCQAQSPTSSSASTSASASPWRSCSWASSRS